MQNSIIFSPVGKAVYVNVNRGLPAKAGRNIKTDFKKGKKIMKREQAILEIKRYFEENEDDFNNAIEGLDSWSGYLGDGRYYYMDELNELYCNTPVIDLLNRAFFGRDDDEWMTDASGNRIYGAFNPNREYFTFNGYGNFVSTDFKDYSVYLTESFIDALIDNSCHIYDLPDEVEEIIERIDYDEEQTA